MPTMETRRSLSAIRGDAEDEDSDRSAPPDRRLASSPASDSRSDDTALTVGTDKKRKRSLRPLAVSASSTYVVPTVTPIPYAASTDPACRNSVRVLRRDIRRSYANMFINCLNGYEVGLMYRFLKQHCKRDVCVYQATPNIHSPAYAFLQGSDLVALHWAWKMRCLPDIAVRIRSVKVYVRSDSERSKIVAEVDVSGTKLYEYPLNDALPALESLDSAQVMCRALVDSAIPLHADTVCVSSRFSGRVSSFSQYMPMTQPVPVKLGGALTFYVDEDRKIDAIEYSSDTGTGGSDEFGSLLDEFIF